MFVHPSVKKVFSEEEYLFSSSLSFHLIINTLKMNETSHFRIGRQMHSLNIKMQLFLAMVMLMEGCDNDFDMTVISAGLLALSNFRIGGSVHFFMK